MSLGRKNTTALLLPMFSNKESQTRFQNGCKELFAGMKWHKRSLPPMQLLISKIVPDFAGQNVFTKVAIELFDMQDVSLGMVSKTPFEYHEHQTMNKAWLQHKGGDMSFDSCGVFYLKITADGVVSYTDTFQLIEVTENEDWFELWISHEKDTSVLYSRGFVDKMLIEAFYDTPEVVESAETVSNLAGEEETYYHNIKERVVLKAPNIGRAQLATLKAIKSLSSVRLKKLSTGEIFDLKEVEIESEEMGNCYHLVKLSFVTGNLVMSCAENENEVLTSQYLLGDGNVLSGEF